MDNVNKTTLTIVTPTYNRGELLVRCYQSLLRQTDKDFEWIIVDDGSTDKTEKIVQKFAADFSIQYIKKENGGKHTALNKSHPYINGKFAMILDSDDYLIDTAVKQINEAWRQYENNQIIGIVIFLKGSTPDTPFCKSKDIDEGLPVDIMRYKRIRCSNSNDCCEVIRSDLLKRYPFPIFDGEKFLSEGALWNRVSLTHKCIYINKVVYIAEYFADGLTKSGRKLRIHNPLGGMYTSSLNMNTKNFTTRRIKNGLLYTCYSFFAGRSIKEISKNNEYKILTWLCMPVGWVLYLYWKRKYF